MAFTDYGGVYGVGGIGQGAATALGASAVPTTQVLKEDALGVMLYEEPTPPQRIVDGLSKTIIVAEMLLRRKQSESEWGNGQNIFDHGVDTPVNNWSGLANDIGSPHVGGAQVLYCDGHVEMLVDEIPQHVLNALITRAGMEVLP